jgi:DNA-binding NtrC family response regulator
MTHDESAVVRPYAQALADFKRAYWQTLVAAYDGKVSQAAAASGMNRTHVYKVLDGLGVPYTRGAQGGHRGRWVDPDTGAPL